MSSRANLGLRDIVHLDRIQFSVRQSGDVTRALLTTIVLSAMAATGCSTSRTHTQLTTTPSLAPDAQRCVATADFSRVVVPLERRERVAISAAIATALNAPTVLCVFADQVSAVPVNGTRVIGVVTLVGGGTAMSKVLFVATRAHAASVLVLASHGAISLERGLSAGYQIWWTRADRSTGALTGAVVRALDQSGHVLDETKVE